MKIPKLFFIAIASAALFFINRSSALADTPKVDQVIYETDNGKMISLSVGHTVQFLLAENIPDTTPWSPSIPWWSVDQDVSFSSPISVYSSTQNPNILTATSFILFAKQKGQAIIYFFKESLIDNNKLQSPIIFAVDVVD
jgi:hypothetical protein